MFCLLDTDHFSALDRESSAGQRFERRRAVAGDDLFISIITVEEVMRGWIGLLGACKAASGQVRVYERMKRSAELIGEWSILAWDDEAFRVFEGLKRQRLRMSTADLKIASIALVHEATLLTRNRADFEKVPGLRMANWLD